MGTGTPTRYRTAAAPVLRKSVDPGRMTISSVLTYPVTDLDGDFIHPAGGRWAADPFVNYEHDPRRVIGRGSVVLKAEGQHMLPVGTTHFRQDDPFAEQVFELVDRDILTGVSLEFLPDPSSPPVPRGCKSARLGRDALEFRAWRGLGWAHCEEPINRHARTLARSHEKALVVAQTGRLPSGRPAHPLLLKAFRPLLDLFPRASSARVPDHPLTRRPEAKAMDELTGADDMPPPDATDTPDPGTGDDTPPTAKAAYDGAQALSDAADMLEAAVQRSEHLKAKKKVLACIQSIRDEAEELSAIGDMVLDDVSDDPTDDPTEPDGDEGGDLPPDGDGDEPPAAYEEKALKIVPLKRRPDGTIVTKSLYAPKRFRLVGGELREAAPAGDASKKAMLDTIRAEIEAERRATRKLARAAR